MLRRAITVLLACLVIAPLLGGQPPDKNKSRLRALGLLEVTGEGRARLVPIVIKVGDEFYDARYYRATPHPMAIDGDIVYEAMRAGDPIGLFTITQLREIGGEWIGYGQWRLKSEEEAEAKPVEKAPPKQEADDRPILRKPKTPGPQPTSPGPSTPAPDKTPAPGPDAKPASTGTTDSGKPSLGPSPKEPSPKEPSAKEDAKPQTKPPTPEETRTEKPVMAASSAVDSDPNRPILRRGAHGQKRGADELPPMAVGKPGALRSMPGAASVKGGAMAGLVEVLPAVSDSGGPRPKSYAMELTPEERAKYETLMRQMALDALRKFAQGRSPGHKPSEELTDLQFQIYDAHYNNEPDMVLSAAVPEALPPGASSSFRFFVTVVARIDMYGDPHQLLADVTDTMHLDAYPKLELIDVVDADGTGSGQLLFRRVGDRSYSFVIYRIGLDKLWPLFEGGERDLGAGTKSE